jgi:DNA-binding transcriptional regulator LsrR (DeoR family)
MQHYWNLLDAAIFGLGGRLSDDTFFAEELGEEYAQYIKRSNFVGDVLAQFFFEDGTSMDLQERYRQTAFAIEKLPKVPKTICLAGGKDKVDALYAGARAGFFKTLVTDSVTARLLYEKIRRQIEQ